jgi:gluconate 5-dehydrogenase
MVHPLFDLTGKAALVTGGSKGLGLAMARGLAECGADVFLASRSVEELKRAKQQVQEGTSARVEYCAADMTDRGQVQHLAKVAEDAFGRVDILINNAGTNQPQPIDQVEDQAWDRLLELNLTSCMALTRALVPGMKARRWGRVIHISSVIGIVGKEGRNAYAATKAGLVGMTRASALDLGPYNITVNCLAPGPFLTDLTRGMLSEDQRQAFAQRTALERWGDPRELVGPALLLASQGGSYITGAVLVVDGGMTIKSF